MAKKKKSRKQRRIAAPVSSVETGPAAVPATPIIKPNPTTTAKHSSPVVEKVENPHAPYLYSDLKRIGLLVVLCVGIEAALWYAFRTSLGSSIYNWVSL